jgi:hypothetical protein
MNDPRLLVAVDGAELEEPDRQFAVGALAGPEDQDVERAVHRLEAVLVSLFERYRREHRVGEPLKVAGDLEKLCLGDVRGVGELVARAHVTPARVVLHDLADHRSFRVEQR